MADACPDLPRKLSPRDFKAHFSNCTRLSRAQFYSTVRTSHTWWIDPPPPQIATFCAIGKQPLRTTQRSAAQSRIRVAVGMLAQYIMDRRTSEAGLLERAAATWLRQPIDWLSALVVHHCPLHDIFGLPNQTKPTWMAASVAGRVQWTCMPPERRRASKSYLFHKTAVLLRHLAQHLPQRQFYLKLDLDALLVPANLLSLLERIPADGARYIGTIEQTSLVGQTRPECGPVTWRECSPEEFCVPPSHLANGWAALRTADAPERRVGSAAETACEIAERELTAQILRADRGVQASSQGDAWMAGAAAPIDSPTPSAHASEMHSQIAHGAWTSSHQAAAWRHGAALWAPASPGCAAQPRNDLVCYGSRRNAIQFAQGGAYLLSEMALRRVVHANCLDAVGVAPCFVRYCYHRNEDVAVGICMRRLGVPLWQCPCFHPNAPCDVTVPGAHQSGCDGRLCERPITVHALRRPHWHDAWWQRLTHPDPTS